MQIDGHTYRAHSQTGVCAVYWDKEHTTMREGARVMSERDMAKVEAANQARREYCRRWRAANRDKVRGYNEKYWLKRALRELEQIKSSEAGENV